MNPCDYGMCNVDTCINPNCIEDTMDTNTITLTLNGRVLTGILNLNGSVFGQRYNTRAKALEMYLQTAEELEAEGVLAVNSGIIN